MIRGLQEELKSAKFVMRNTRLRTKLQEMASRTPILSSSVKPSRMGSIEDLPKVGHLESPVKTKARITTCSPDVLHSSFRVKAKFSLFE
jgi:hypothetical protein